MRPSTHHKTLTELATVKYATLNNLYAREANSLKGSFLQTRKNLKKLIEQGLVKELPSYTFVRQVNREVFFTPTARGFKAIGLPSVYADEKSLSPHIVMHESAKVDLVLSFYKLFPDYLVEIDYLSRNRAMNIKGKSYKPDAIVKLKTPDLSKELHFILEFERTREPNKIVKEKLEMLKDLNFRKNGLSDKTKILIVFANSHFDTFLRPTEYQDQPDALKVLQKQFMKLRELATGYDSRRFLFMTLPDFHKLDEAVWYNPKGDRVKLI